MKRRSRKIRAQRHKVRHSRKRGAREAKRVERVKTPHGDRFDVVEYTLPIYWASYLVNGDASGLEPGEQEQIDAWLEREGNPHFVDVSEDVHFAHTNDATRLGGDVAIFTAHVRPGAREVSKTTGSEANPNPVERVEYTRADAERHARRWAATRGWKYDENSLLPTGKGKGPGQGVWSLYVRKTPGARPERVEVTQNELMRSANEAGEAGSAADYPDMEAALRGAQSRHDATHAIRGTTNATIFSPSSRGFVKRVGFREKGFYHWPDQGALIGDLPSNAEMIHRLIDTGWDPEAAPAMPASMRRAAERSPARNPVRPTGRKFEPPPSKAVVERALLEHLRGSIPANLWPNSAQPHPKNWHDALHRQIENRFPNGLYYLFGEVTDYVPGGDYRGDVWFEPQSFIERERREQHAEMEFERDFPGRGKHARYDIEPDEGDYIHYTAEELEQLVLGMRRGGASEAWRGRGGRRHESPQTQARREREAKIESNRQAEAAFLADYTQVKIEGEAAQRAWGGEEVRSFTIGEHDGVPVQSIIRRVGDDLFLQTAGNVGWLFYRLEPRSADEAGESSRKDDLGQLVWTAEHDPTDKKTSEAAKRELRKRGARRRDGRWYDAKGERIYYESRAMRETSEKPEIIWEAGVGYLAILDGKRVGPYDTEEDALVGYYAAKKEKQEHGGALPRGWVYSEEARREKPVKTSRVQTIEDWHAAVRGGWQVEGHYPPLRIQGRLAGKHIITSPIVSAKGRIVRTESGSAYRLGRPYDSGGGDSDIHRPDESCPVLVIGGEAMINTPYNRDHHSSEGASEARRRYRLPPPPDVSPGVPGTSFYPQVTVFPGWDNDRVLKKINDRQAEIDPSSDEWEALRQKAFKYVKSKGAKPPFYEKDEASEAGRIPSHGPKAAKAIEDAIALFPETFGLHGHPGDKFRISRSASYINDDGQVTLYTERFSNGGWRDFAKGSVGELHRNIVEFPASREVRDNPHAADFPAGATYWFRYEDGALAAYTKVSGGWEERIHSKSKGWPKHGERGDLPPSAKRIGSEPLREVRDNPVDDVVGDALPWVKVSRDPERYEAALKEAKAIGPIDDPKKVYELVGPALLKEDQETFIVILLDVRQQCRGVAEIHRGGRSRVPVSLVDVLRVVVASGAEGFVVVHNHPSGKASPSDADKDLTKSIERAAKLFDGDLSFVDHVICGSGEFYSFADEKLHKAKA